jgi:hypothetical protein
VWWSDSASVLGFGKGRSTRMMPVSALSQIPGVGCFLAWMAAVPVAGFLGLLVAGLPAFRTGGEGTETLFGEGPKQSVRGAAYRGPRPCFRANASRSRDA